MHNALAMTRRDYAWLRMDTAKNLMIINCILLFDGSLNFPRLASTIAERIVHFPRFTQRASTRLAMPCWGDDPSFDVWSHLTLMPSPAVVDEQALQDLISGIANRPLDRGRPLWHMTVIDKVNEGYAILFRLHHSITDGLGLVHVLEHLTDAKAQPDKDGHAKSFPSHSSPPSANRGQSINVMKFVGHIARLALLPCDMKTVLKSRLGGTKKLVWLPAFPLENMARIANSMGVSVNDVWLCIVTGALRQYLSQRGECVDTKKTLRAAVTFNMRDSVPACHLGNEFTLVALDLPSNERSPAARLRAVHQRMVAIKRSYQPSATIAFLSLVGHLSRPLQRIAINLFTSKASVIVTNLAGPGTCRYLDGSRLDAFHCWVPQSGRLGGGFSLMSYAGKVRIGLYVDDQVVPEPHRLLDLVLIELRQLGNEAGADAAPALYDGGPNSRVVPAGSGMHA